MNERDSEAVAAQLVSKGYDLAPTESTADVILLNTCSVRDLAEQKAPRKMENLIGQTRRARPDVVLGFMGCMAQSRGQQLIDKLPDVDLVIGTQKFHRTSDYLDEILQGRREKVVDVAEENGSQSTIREHLLAGNGKKSVRAYVSIMQGCNQYCTFCIVPYTRGEERSRTIPDIVAECRELVANGVREITLLGQIVTSYGRRGASRATLVNGNEKTDGQLSPVAVNASGQTSAAVNVASPFVQLLRAVHEIEGLARLRFTSPHPKGYGDDLVEAYGLLPKLVESAHIPVQSGSDRVLKWMHRGYTRERYLRTIAKLRDVKPHMGISTDFIVGFPGETDEDFGQTLSLAREVEFDQAYIFKYSPRRDTPAATMPEQVPPAVKEERHEKLLSMINEIAAKRYSRMTGQLVEILVEGPSKRPERLLGRTRCNKIVLFEGSNRQVGELINVRVTRAGSFTLYGDPMILE